MSARSFHAVVVGGGPAGANAALWLARAGRQVALVEKETLPRDKTCGGGVVGRAHAHVPPDLELPIQRECRAISMRLLDEGRELCVERSAAVISMTMRSELDRALVEAARRAGAEVLAPCRVDSIEDRGDSVELQTTAGLLRGDYAVLADGATGPCARFAGWKQPLSTIPALEAEVRVPRALFESLERTAVFDFGAIEAGYAWIFPKREHLSIGVLTMRRGNAGLRAVLDRYLHDSGVREIVSIDVHGYVIPVAPRAEGLARGRVLLAGDAAGLADPVTGEGISLALHSGRIAADAIASGASAPSAPSANGARAVRRAYEHAMQRSILGELRIARAVAHVLYRRPRLARWLLDRTGQRLCEVVADVMAGERTYGELLQSPRAWAGLLRRDR